MSYVPASMPAFVTDGPNPEKPGGPVAVIVQSVVVAVPPLSLTTTFLSVSDAGSSSFVMTHVTASPLSSVTVSPSSWRKVGAGPGPALSGLQTQSDAAYPAGPDSER